MKSTGTCWIVWVFIFVLFSQGQSSSPETTSPGDPSPAPSEAGCRMDRGRIDGGRVTLWKSEDFRRQSCSYCYSIVAGQNPSVLIHNTSQFLRYNTSSGLLFDYAGNTFEPDSKDETGVPFLGFRTRTTAKLWDDCCQQADQCCQNMISQTAVTTKAAISVPCVGYWDTFGCWPSLSKGEFHENDCSDYLFSFFPKSPCKRFARRKCFGGGQWSSTNMCESREFHRYGLEPSSNDNSTCPITPVDTISSSTTLSPDVVDYSEKPRCCRTEQRYELSERAFQLEACARCFNYLPVSMRGTRLQYVPWLGALNDTVMNQLVYADPSNPLCQVIMDTLNDPRLFCKWEACCQQAKKCCVHMSNTPRDNISHIGYCPRTWDGWQCFDDTKPGTTAYVDCPDHVYFNYEGTYTCPHSAEKKCQSSGLWAVHKDGSGREYTDYLTCATTLGQTPQEYFYIGCLAVSLVALIPALFIFSCYRQLRVARIQMHQNFFLSLILNCIFTILYRILIILPQLDPDTPTNDTPIFKNTAGCKVLLVLVRYFRLSNYTWMLCEGFYLQRLITAAFAEQKRLFIFYIIGWVVPPICMTAYSISKKLVDDNLCWTEPGALEWIFGVPSIVCILLNLVFLCNIIRVLVTKLRSIQSNEPSHYRKAVRATLVLIPLFGVHFILVMYNGQHTSCDAFLVYRYFKDGVDGLQGFIVALIFCYMNGEILYLLKRSYERFKINHGMQIIRARLSMSTQVTVQDIYTTHHKATPPMANGAAKRSRVDSNSKPTTTTTSAKAIAPATLSETETPPQVTGSVDEDGFYNVALGNEKTTEL